MFQQRVGPWFPIYFCLGCKARHRISLQSHGVNAKLFALHKSCAGSAELVQNEVALRQTKMCDVMTNEVRGERQNKSIPIMDSPIFRSYAVTLAFSAEPDSAHLR